MGDSIKDNNDNMDGLEDYFADEKYNHQPDHINGIPVIHITKEEHIRLCRPWRRGLIIKLLGKNLPRKFLET